MTSDDFYTYTGGYSSYDPDWLHDQIYGTHTRRDRLIAKMYDRTDYTQEAEALRKEAERIKSKVKEQPDPINEQAYCPNEQPYCPEEQEYQVSEYEFPKKNNKWEESYKSIMKTLEEYEKETENDNLDSVSHHHRLTQYLNNLYEKKNKAYGNSFHDTYEKMGIISAMTRISDKYNRAVKLATNPDIDPNDESIKDTLLDMANYCIMTVMEIEQKEN